MHCLSVALLWADISSHSCHIRPFRLLTVDSPETSLMTCVTAIGSQTQLHEDEGRCCLPMEGGRVGCGISGKFGSTHSCDLYTKRNVRGLGQGGRPDAQGEDAGRG